MRIETRATALLCRSSAAKSTKDRTKSRVAFGRSLYIGSAGESFSGIPGIVSWTARARCRSSVEEVMQSQLLRLQATAPVVIHSLCVLPYAYVVPLPEVCVCYLLRDSRVVLGEKISGLGRGKIVGPGGKLEGNETPQDAIIREVFEETSIVLSAASLRPAGELDYLFPHRPRWSQKSWVFTCDDWEGEPQASDELVPSWFEIERLPLQRMWDDARLWLPTVLNGGTLRAVFEFGPDNNTVNKRW